MAQQVVETSRVFPVYTMRMPLDGVEYLLRFVFNQREASWYLSILDIDEVPLLEGVFIDANRQILSNKWVRKCFVDNELVKTVLPAGDFVGIDLTGLNTSPGLDELGADARVVLTYFDEEGVAEAAVA